MDDVVAVVTDLFFQSRIQTSASKAGRGVRFLATDDAVGGVTDFRLALVDLDAGIDVLSAIRKLSMNEKGSVLAFGPHVDTSGRKAAKDAGASRVLAKSRFVTELPKLLEESSS